MENTREYYIPSPVLNKKEKELLNSLTEQYEKLCKPGLLDKAGKKVGEMMPAKMKELLDSAKSGITKQELYAQCMKVVADGFGVVEKYAANMTLSESAVIKNANKLTQKNTIESLDEICLLRAYSVGKGVSKYKKMDLGIALVEGAATGAFGFAGLPFNLVLCVFLFYRAVQSVGMIYGYDVKNDPAELVIAEEVLMNALNPNGEASDEIAGIVGKVMVMTEVTTVKQMSKKSWQAMAEHGGIPLLMAQMRALANAAAKKAVDKAGKKSLEGHLFENVFTQIGKKLTKEAAGKSAIGIGAIIGALFDTSQMNKVIDYANVFYGKRFIFEKEERINTLLGEDDDIIDVDEFELQEVEE